MNGINKKILAAIRLKNLRLNIETKDNKPVSHLKLSKMLDEKYGHLKTEKNATRPIISDKTLLNYEISEPEHPKFEVGYGMSVRNLSILSDFYNVSYGFLLGSENVVNDNLTQLSSEVGLQKSSINILKDLNQSKQFEVTAKRMLDVINTLIQSINAKSMKSLSKSFIFRLSKYFFFNGQDDMEPCMSDEDCLDLGLMQLIKEIIELRKLYKHKRDLETKRIQYQIKNNK